MNPKQAIVVLGTGFMPDGSLRPQAKVRVEKAIELFSKGNYSCIIFSGRFPDWYMDPVKCPEYREIMKNPPTEAKLMYAYALRLSDKNPILKQKIKRRSVLDSEAKTTPENLVNAARIAKAKGINYVTVVTNDFHARRVQLLAAQRGFPREHMKVVGANTENIPLDGDRKKLFSGERNKAREVIANLRKAKGQNEPLMAQQIGWPTQTKLRIPATLKKKRTQNPNKLRRL